MLTNLHTHTTFCDGKSSPEETVLKAIEKGFVSLGFSGHGYTDFDPLSYCMRDTEAYRAEIIRLREKYKKEIEIYLGVEEDAGCLQRREDFDYIIGSSHYLTRDGAFYHADSSPEWLDRTVAAFGGDPIAVAESYYSNLVPYIKKRRPDIIGHFDLLTKFEEKATHYFLSNPEYHSLTERYIREALRADCMFEVNTGAISRGWRTAPYPRENLLRIIKAEGGRITITSDCHHADNLDCFFAEARKFVRDIGFEHIYVLYHGEWTKDYL